MLAAVASIIDLESYFLWLGPLLVQNLGGRGILDSEGGALHFCKLAALKLPLPVTAHSTEVKRNITELRGGKKKENQTSGKSGV